MKLYIHLTLKHDWVKLKSCSNDLVIVCICWLFWQKYLVLLEQYISTAPLEHPGKRIASNSFHCVTSKIFLQFIVILAPVQIYFINWRQCSSLCFTEVITGAVELFFLAWMLNRTEGTQHDSLIPGSVFSAAGCEEIHTITALSISWTGLFVESPSNINKHFYSFPC